MIPPQESVILDCYNQAVVKDVAITITTRIDACNHYYLLERIEMEQNTDKPIYIGNVYNKGGEKGSDGGNIYDPEGVCRCLTSWIGGAGQTFIIEQIDMEQPKIIQKVGDRGTDNYSIHEDYANCVPVNPMSDRGQLVVEPRVMQIGNTTEGAKRENPQRGRVYSMDGIAPTIYTCGGGNLGPQILEPVMLKTQRTDEAKERRKVHGDFGVKFSESKEFTVKDDGVSKAVTTFAEKELIIAEPVTCAMRGRNPENPSDRTSGIPTEQRIEFGGDVANCLTSVQKDSMVAEPISHVIASEQKHAYVGSTESVSPCLTEAMGSGGGNIPMVTEPAIRTCVYKEMPDGAIRGYRPNASDKRGISEEQYDNPESIASTVTTAHVPKTLESMVSAHPISHAHENPQPNPEFAPTLRATDNKYPPVVYEPVQYYYRIRKLHPIETYRLQDVDDEDIAKLMNAKKAKDKPLIAKTKHYALAGNSITVAVLVHLFDKLFYPDPAPASTPKPIQLTLF